MTMTRLVRPMDSNATLVGKEQIDFPKHVGSVGLTSSKGFALHKTGHYGRDVARYTSCKILEEPERAITRCGTARGMRTPPFKSEMHCPFYIRNAAFEHPCSKKSYENIEKLKKHIFRNHTTSDKCNNCQTLSAIPELKQSELSCTALNEEQICRGLFRNLCTFRYPLASAKTDIESWDILYRTIFPGDQLIPSRFFPAPQDHSPKDGYENVSHDGPREKSAFTVPVLETRASGMRKGKHGVKLVGASSDHHIEEVKDVEDGIQEVASTERTPPSLTEDTSRDNGTYEEKIVSQVVDRFVFMAKQELLNHLRAVMERPQPYEAPTGSRQNQVTSTLTSSYSSSSNQNDGGTSKRHREGGKDPGDGDGGSDGDDEDDDRRRGKKPRSNDRNSPRKRLRCPFYLNNPIKYGTYQACSSGMGFEDMGRLRQHLTRNHVQPLRCPRCQQEMNSKEGRVEHLLRTPLCQSIPSNDDRISHDRWEDIDPAREPRLRTIEEKYKHLYAKIFPNDAKSPNPYERSFILSEMEDMLSAALEREFSNEVTLTMNRIKQRIPAIVQYCQSRIDQSESSEAVSDDPFIDPAYRKEQCRNDRSRRGRNNPNTNETPSTPRTPRTRRNESKRSSHALPKAKPTLETQALIQEMESSASMSGAFTDPILTPAESSATHTSLYDSSLTPSWNPTINQQSAETFDTGQSDFSALQQTPSLTPNPSDAWTSTCSYESESIPSQSFFPPTNPFSQQFDPNNIMGEDDCTVQQNTLQCTFTNFPQPIAPHFGRQSQQPYNAESWNSFHQNMNTSNFPQSSNANHIGGWASSNTYPLNTRTDQHSYTVQSLDDRAGAYIDQDEVSLSNNVQHNPFLRNRDAGTRDQQGRQIPERTKRSGNRAEAEMDSYFHFPES